MGRKPLEEMAPRVAAISAAYLLRLYANAAIFIAGLSYFRSHFPYNLSFWQFVGFM